jgi:hypothetical protein
VVRAVDGTEGLCPIHVLRRRLAGNDPTDLEVPRLRPHERKALLEPPPLASIAVAASITFGGRGDDDAQEEALESQEPFADDEELARAAKAAKREKGVAAERLRTASVATFARKAETEATAAAKAAATARARVKTATAEAVKGGGVWPDDESDGQVPHERDPSRRRPAIRRRGGGGLNAADAAATAFDEPDWAANTVRPGTGAGQRGAVHLPPSPLSPDFENRNRKDEIEPDKHGGEDVVQSRNAGESHGHGMPSPEPNPEEIVPGRHRLNEMPDNGAHPTSGDGDSGRAAPPEERRLFVELPQQPLGQMFDRRRRGLASRRRRRGDIPPDIAGSGIGEPAGNDVSDRDGVSHPPAGSMLRGLRSAAASIAKPEGGGLHAQDPASEEQIRAARHEARREAEAVATASLGHFSQSSARIPLFAVDESSRHSRDGSAARPLAEVASAVMSYGEREEVLAGMSTEAKRSSGASVGGDLKASPVSNAGTGGKGNWEGSWFGDLLWWLCVLLHAAA